jgi:hypothetical protein
LFGQIGDIEDRYLAAATEEVDASH